MITRIYVPKKDTQVNKDFPKYLLDALILLDKIDINFYNIKIDKVNWQDSSDFLGYDYYIDYNLERDIIWDDLEECKERLRIGL